MFEKVHSCKITFIFLDLNKKTIVDKQNLTEQANLIKRFKRKLLLVSKERDSYKGVLESYEHELTFTGAAFEKDRITALEISLNDYKDTVERLEELLSNARYGNIDCGVFKLRDTKLGRFLAKNEQVQREKLTHNMAVIQPYFLPPKWNLYLKLQFLT